MLKPIEFGPLAFELIALTGPTLAEMPFGL